jgi:hypothetical protein
LVINPAGSSSNVASFEITFARTSARFKIATFVPSEFTQRVVAADLNHDGKLDLLGVLSFANAISVRLGNGNGTFQAETLYPLAVSPADIVVRDFDNDGNPDVAARLATALSPCCSAMGLEFFNPTLTVLLTRSCTRSESLRVTSISMGNWIWS